MYLFIFMHLMYMIACANGVINVPQALSHAIFVLQLLIYESEHVHSFLVLQNLVFDLV